MRLEYLYHYKMRKGTFWIAPQPESPGRFWLGVDGKVLGSYNSPIAAADDVYCQATGWCEWDSLEPVMSPTDLSEWTKGPPDDL